MEDPKNVFSLADFYILNQELVNRITREEANKDILGLLNLADEVIDFDYPGQVYKFTANDKSVRILNTSEDTAQFSFAPRKYVQIKQDLESKSIIFSILEINPANIIDHTRGDLLVETSVTQLGHYTFDNRSETEVSAIQSFLMKYIDFKLTGRISPLFQPIPKVLIVPNDGDDNDGRDYFFGWGLKPGISVDMGLYFGEVKITKMLHGDLIFEKKSGDIVKTGYSRIVPNNVHIDLVKNVLPLVTFDFAEL